MGCALGQPLLGAEEAQARKKCFGLSARRSRPPGSEVLSQLPLADQEFPVGVEKLTQQRPFSQDCFVRDLYYLAVFASITGEQSRFDQKIDECFSGSWNLLRARDSATKLTGLVHACEMRHEGLSQQRLERFCIVESQSAISSPSE